MPTTAASHLPALLFTAFEPSGDDHASAVIAELKRRHPDLPIYAWGGPKMAAAGAILIERTGEDAVVGVPAISKLLEHRHINQRIAAWLDNPPADVVLHIAVDSPAANFPICKIAKRRGLKVAHLVAPQIWAWGSWRSQKLRRLTDMVLCLLPFEEEWFLNRRVPARFVGHPLFDHPIDEAELSRRSAGFGDGSPRIALMPGSRPAEQSSAFPILLDAFRRIRRDFPTTAGVVAATRPEVAARLRTMAEARGGWPDGLRIVSGDTDAVIHWCQFALVVSGTVTLQIARQARPMVAFYRPTRLFWHLIGRWIISTDVFTLPNLIARRRIIVELIPHFEGGEPLAVEIIRLMRQPGYADTQRQELRAIAQRFRGVIAAKAAADTLELLADLPSSSPNPIAALHAAPDQKDDQDDRQGHAQRPQQDHGPHPARS